MKEVYQVYTKVNGETVKKFESEKLSEAGFFQGKLIAAGVSSWLQIAIDWETDMRKKESWKK